MPNGPSFLCIIMAILSRPIYFELFVFLIDIMTTFWLESVFKACICRTVPLIDLLALFGCFANWQLNLLPQFWCWHAMKGQLLFSLCDLRFVRFFIVRLVFPDKMAFCRFLFHLRWLCSFNECWNRLFIFLL